MCRMKLLNQNVDVLLCYISEKPNKNIWTKKNAEVQVLGRESIGEYSNSFNTMADAHSAHKNEISWNKDKLGDLEYRSRRNNLKIRGIPKTVPTAKLPQYVQDMFSTLAPTD